MHNTLNKIVDEMLERDTRRKREAGERRAASHRRIRRITLSGDDVDKFIADPRAQEPASWVKVFFPWRDTLAGRAYTLSGIDKLARTFDIDMVLHGEGPASNWARDAMPGDKLGFAGPCSGGFRLLPQTRWLLLLGDETALPAMRTILASLSARCRCCGSPKWAMRRRFRTSITPFAGEQLANPHPTFRQRDEQPAGAGRQPLRAAARRRAGVAGLRTPGRRLSEGALYQRNGHFPRCAVCQGLLEKGEANFKGAI